MMIVAKQMTADLNNVSLLDIAVLRGAVLQERVAGLIAEYEISVVVGQRLAGKGQMFYVLFCNGDIVFITLDMPMTQHSVDE